VTGHELKYTALVGKPSEITYRYAEHCLARHAKKLGYDAPLKNMYLVG
jgi:ribonucleotide monophosphatase NagD (HAD superfamily)